MRLRNVGLLLRLRTAAVIVALAIVGPACGVTTQDRPVPIDRKDVPFGLLEGTPSDSAVPSTTTSVPTRP